MGAYGQTPCSATMLRLFMPKADPQGESLTLQLPLRAN